MNERRFDVLLSLVLLAFGIWYAIRMATYPDSAGRVPAIVAAVMVAALIVQLILTWRQARRGGPADTVGGSDPAAPAGASSPPATGGREPEPDSYQTLVAIHGVRLRRFVTIVAFSCAFVLGFLVVGFVVTTGVLITAILLVARERLYVALIGGLVSVGASYLLVVFLAGQSPLSGWLFE